MERNVRRTESEPRASGDLLQAGRSFRRMSSGTITLNVGGHTYAATRQTLARHPGSLLEEIANRKRPLQPVDSAGNAFIDRDGPVFRHVLNFLRLGELHLPRGFAEAGLLRREAEFYQLGALVQAVQDWERQREPSFLEVSDSQERSKGLSVYSSSAALIEAVKARLLQVSKSRLYRFPEELQVSAHALQFRHFTKSETGSRLVLLEDSTFLFTLESLKREIFMLALREGYALLTRLDSTRGSVVHCEALHFAK